MLAPLLVAAAAALAPGAGEEPVPPAAVPQEPPPPAAQGVRRSWFVLPTVFWLPETKLGLAVAGGRDFRLEASRRTSTALAIGAVSVEGLGSLDGSVDAWLAGGSLLSVRLRGVVYPDHFYGIGPDTPSSGSEPFTRKFVELSSTAELAALDGRLRAGPRLNARTEEIDDVVSGGRVETSGLPGVNGFDGIALGLSVTWDTRDDPLWPRSGLYAQATYLRYPAALGHNDGFGKGNLDLRAFQPLGERPVLAGSATLETSDGATPFTLLPKLGSSRFLRGYREGRYRDRLMWAAQVELRTPVHGPLGATVFVGAGDVAPDLGALGLDTVKVAGGAGARWRLTRAGANLRLDVAVGAEGPEVYLLLLEAF